MRKELENKLLKKAGTPREVAQIYGIPEGSLANLRWRRKGPRFYRRGRGIIYFFADVEKWLKKSPVLTVDSLPGAKGE